MLVDANTGSPRPESIRARLSTLHDALNAAVDAPDDRLQALIAEQDALLRQCRHVPGRTIWKDGEQWLASDGYFHHTGSYYDGLGYHIGLSLAPDVL